VRCDALLLAQLLENLVDNALKYSDPPAPVELAVQLREGHVVFAVRDRGPGVAPPWREKVFDVFQRGEPRPQRLSDRARRGAGVGLAVCRAIARAWRRAATAPARQWRHQFRVLAARRGTATRSVGQGRRGAPGRPAGCNGHRGARRRRGRCGMSLRVLLVEDDRGLRGMLRDALEVEGYAVVTAASLAEGLALLANLGKRPRHANDPGTDLVLLDLGLPDGEGEELLAALRRRHALPLIVISARESDGQKIRLPDAGADDYLVKPFGVGELLARMRVALRHHGTRLAPAVTRYEHGSLLVDLDRREIRADGVPVHLTPTEFTLLARLVRSAGRVVTHRQLLADVWGPEHTADTHYWGVCRGCWQSPCAGAPTRRG
jgi:two-component system KDP operon response regulator KdpE